MPKMSKVQQHCGFISLLYSIGDKPLNLWSKHVSPNGKIRRVTDETLNGDKVIEITGPHDVPVYTNIACPSDSMEILNLKLPILVLIIRNLKLKLKLEFQILDKKKYRRKFTFTTYDSLPVVDVSAVRLPLKLEEGWNNLEINFQTLCYDIFGSNYEALQRIIIYPNCRLRRVYLQDRHYEHDETPVELCQAFFDMYMLKWGIHLVERSSQTEEPYTGPLQPRDLECITTESNISISVVPKSCIALYNVSRQTGNKFISCTHMVDKDKIAKFNSKSVNELEHKNACIQKTSLNVEITNNFRNEDRGKKSADQQEETKTPSICSNDKEMFSQKAFPHIEKSKYLQMHGCFLSSEFDNEGNIFQKWPYKYDELSRGIKSVPALKGGTNTDSWNQNFTGHKIMTFPSEKSPLYSKDTKGIKDIINEVQRIREELQKNKSDFKALVTQENVNDLAVIPHIVEMEALSEEVKSKSKLLTTDEIVNDFLKFRYIMNETIFERLREKGLTMTEVELSIYNSKNRRNCYGQGKLKESFRRCTNKGSGFKQINPSETDVSLKKEKLRLSDALCTKIRSELDTILPPLEPIRVKASSQFAQHMHNMSEDFKEPSHKHLFTIQETAGVQNVRSIENSLKPRNASVNYLWRNVKLRSSDVISTSEKCDINNRKIKMLFYSESCN